MNDFIFNNPTRVYFGKNQINHLGEELSALGKKILLVYGGGSIKKIGLYDKVTDEINKNDLECIEFPGIEPNPRHTTVNKGAKICKDEDIDVVLAVGGGSVIDAAKAIAATAKYEGDDCWDFVTGKAMPLNHLPIVSVVTLAATGSETHPGGVVSNEELNEKQTIFGPTLQPVVSFLDPTNTFSVSRYQTASGSVDIMAHIFDVAYFSTQQEMDMLLNMQEDVFKAVVKYAPIALETPEDYDARANLLWASSFALNGFIYSGIMQDIACHMIEHELSAFYDITHGHGLAIIIPKYLSYILNDVTAPRIKRLGVNVFGVDDSLSDIDGAKTAIAELEKFYFKTLGLQSKLSDLGIDDEKFSIMAKKACGPNGKISAFVELTPDDVENILRMCL